MARYERDYGRDFGRHSGPTGGMRSDGYGGTNWQNFPGEEGWYGEGRAGGSNPSYGAGYPGEWESRGRGFDGPYGGFGPQQPMEGYGFERGFRGSFGDRGQGGFPQESGRGYGGRGYGFEGGYTDWQERGGWRNQERGFTRARASQIMTENPEAVTPDTEIAEVARRMRDLDVGIIPVVESMENRRLRGVITDRDIAVRAVAEGREGSTRIEECMTQRVRTVNKNDSVDEVMRVMREEQVRRVPVTDREGRLVGIIAQADLAVDFGNEREVGETVEQISEPARPQR